MAFSFDPMQAKKSWLEIVAKYQNPDVRKSVWQIINSILPYVALWALMYFSMQYSYWLTLLLAVPTAGFTMRIFIILHDCGHGSFFKSQKANDIIGSICGVITYTPYFQWRHEHAIHHATSGHLDRRGVGDVMTLTVKEYMALSGPGKLKYRLYRNPFVMFLFAPLYVFFISHRFISSASSKARERNSVHYTNLAILAVILVLSYFIGFKEFWLVQFPIMALSSSAGVWMFYVQHQFEETYWEHAPEWQYVRSAMQGSSYYKLPKILQWFTGNIGFHHIHHLNPRIPNYNLEKCLKENEIFQRANIITLWASFKTMSYKLWDEETNKLVGFGYIKKFKLNQAR